jgi:hypothetical protein
MLLRLTVIVALMLPACSGGRHPSDAELERVFAQNPDKFQALVNMADQDRHVTRIAPDFTWLDTNVAWPRPESELGFTRQRWDDYRALFKNLGITEGTNRPEGSDLLFLIASARGLVTGGSSKGYVYSRTTLSSSELPLDQVTPSGKSGVIYKHLEGDWYLYLDWD